MTSDSLDSRALALIDVALDQPSATREAWLMAACGDGPQLAARAVALLHAGDNAPSRLRTGGAAAEAAEPVLPTRIGAYRITGLIGQGGMGAVYRGERASGDFDHVVAIKLIRPGVLSDGLVARFQRERQTLARLSHPNIARLLDGGETPAGEPYFVMELVDGERLSDWLARGPARPARVALVLGVCAAVGFAHQNLIIHCDLTPSNILVAKDGTPKLIDFGIARPPATPSAPTRLGTTGSAATLAMSLTPGFAAPERLAGQEATTLSDIYSLGQLLAVIFPQHDADLAAVIARARRVDPADRYPSADALADDIRAWTGGRVVAARNGGRRDAVAKFVRRNGAAVAAGAGALVLLVGALGATLVANARAEIARAEAETRFAQTRAIARVLLFDAFDEVGKVPGGTHARAMMAETGQAYLLALAAQDGAPREIRTETALGFLRLANVVGGSGDGSLGRLEEGNKLMARATAIIDPQFAAFPSDPAVIRAKAAVLYEQTAFALYNDNDPKTARHLANQLVALLAPIAAADAETARLYAGGLQGLGDSWAWDNDHARARDAFARGEAFIAALPPRLASAQPVRKVRSANMRLLGEAYHKLGQPGPARTAIDRAVALNRELVAGDPQDPVLLRKLANSLRYRAVVHRTNKRDALATQSITEASAVVRDLMARGNGDATSVEQVGMTSEVESQMLADTGRHADAARAGETSLAAFRRLVALGGGVAARKRQLAMATMSVAGNDYAAGARERGCTRWRSALDILEGLDRDKGLSGYDREGPLAELRRGLAQCAAGSAVTAFDDD